jgi:hypothetical protein
MPQAKKKTGAIIVPRVDLRAPDATQQLRRPFKALRQRILQSPDPAKAARDLLITEGILTKSGPLSRHYKSS